MCSFSAFLKRLLNLDQKVLHDLFSDEIWHDNDDLFEKPQTLHHLQPADHVISKLVVQWLHLDRADVLQARLMGKVDGTEQAFVTAAERVDGVGKIGAYLGPDLLAGEAQCGFLDAVEAVCSPFCTLTALDSNGFSAKGIAVDLVA